MKQHEAMNVHGILSTKAVKVTQLQLDANDEPFFAKLNRLVEGHVSVF